MTGVPAAVALVVVPPAESFPSPPHPASASTAIGTSMYLTPGIRPGSDFGFDYRTAATHFERASTMPGAPSWLKTLAGTTLIAGGDREAARTLWQELYTTADGDWMRRAAEYRLAQLRALDEIDGLTARVAEVARRLGRPPATWAEVVNAGALPGVPADPTGVAYSLGGDGRVTLGESSELSPLPSLETHR